MIDDDQLRKKNVHNDLVGGNGTCRRQAKGGVRWLWPRPSTYSISLENGVTAFPDVKIGGKGVQNC